jgi:hypothetical protein
MVYVGQVRAPVTGKSALWSESRTVCGVSLLIITIVIISKLMFFGCGWRVGLRGGRGVRTEVERKE